MTSYLLMRVLQEAPHEILCYLVGNPHCFIESRKGGFMRVSCKILVHGSHVRHIGYVHILQKVVQKHAQDLKSLSYHTYYYDMLSFDDSAGYLLSTSKSA